MNLGRAIKTVRNAKSIGQQELAETLGVTANYLSLLENNKRNPSLSTVQHIADALHVPLPILVFLATGPSEIAVISPELAEKLSAEVLTIIGMHA